MEQNDARDAQTVKTLLESRREGRRKGEDGGGVKPPSVDEDDDKTDVRGS